jgi:hypothetical protein
MDRIIVVTGFAPIPVEGPFAETPVCILPSLEPEYAEDDGLPPGFAGRPFSPNDCRLSMDSDEVVAWQYTAQWRDATPEELTPGFYFEPDESPAGGRLPPL